jgi:uncharacterized membrane protein YedE/YeeE
VTPLHGMLKVKRISVDKKHINGAVIFGIGWAITGICPATSAAMLGSGIGYGAVVMAGILLGVLIFDHKWRKETGIVAPQADAE